MTSVEWVVWGAAAAFCTAALNILTVVFLVVMTMQMDRAVTEADRILDEIEFEMQEEAREKLATGKADRL